MAGRSAARLGELRPDLWLRPANVAISADLPDTLITRGPVVRGDEHELVRQLWDLDDLGIRSELHRKSLDDTAVRLEAVDDRSLADAFIALAAALHFLRIEPQLPSELAPNVAADQVRTRYAEVLDVFQARLADFFGRRGGRTGDPVSTGVR